MRVMGHSHDAPMSSSQVQSQCSRSARQGSRVAPQGSRFEAHGSCAAADARRCGQSRMRAIADEDLKRINAFLVAAPPLLAAPRSCWEQASGLTCPLTSSRP